MYPVCPCDDEYVLGAPIFERATLSPDEGKKFTIVAKGARKGHRYVSRARLNGEPLRRSSLDHGEITAGGALELTLRPAEETLRYEQRTWRLAGVGALPSHWEVGLCWLTLEGEVRLTSAQNGRSEAMTGRATTENGWLVLELTSVTFGLDERMVSASRTIRLSAEAIEYEQRMATTRVAEETVHLRNRLVREA